MALLMFGPPRDRSALAEVLAPYDGEDLSAPLESDFFLTVVMRTQGTRPEPLRDALLCLAGQIDQDFEVLVMAHNPPDDQILEQLRLIVDEEVPTLASRVKVVASRGSSRSRPLNDAVRLARGAYVAFFDDDDLVLANWVSTFHECARATPGRLVRTVVVDQSCEYEQWGDERGLIAAGSLQHSYPSRFALFDHLQGGSSPFHAFAFPREAFAKLNLRFDESIAIFEDWDIEMRSASYLGVHSDETVTAIYRRHANVDNSMKGYSEEELLAIFEEMVARLTKDKFFLVDGSELVLFRRSTRELAEMWHEKDWFYRENAHLKELMTSPRWLAKQLREVLRERRENRKK